SPLLYVMIRGKSLVPWDNVDVPLLPVFALVASGSSWVGSSLYHLFMNYNHDPRWYKRLLTFDMIGIWVTQSFGRLDYACNSHNIMHVLVVAGLFFMVSATGADLLWMSTNDPGNCAWA
ncbi:unnamed protein product, partial [Notodromas monacha]